MYFGTKYVYAPAAGTSPNGWVMKQNSTGGVVWARSVYGDVYTYPIDCAVDSSTGSLYLMGNTDSSYVVCMSFEADPVQCSDLVLALPSYCLDWALFGDNGGNKGKESENEGQPWRRGLS